MAEIHLDTSFLIRSARAGFPEDLFVRNQLERGQRLSMSTVAWAEFLCGPLSQSAIALAARIVTELIPFGENQTEVAAILFNQSGRRRGSMIDCMIAAAALERGAELATSDLKDFERLETLGLRLVTFP